MANVPISNFTVPANTVGIGATGYSLTGSASASFIDLAGTWNTSGTPTLIKANVTDTASNANSLLMDLQVGGSSRFKIEKGGLAAFGNARIGNARFNAIGIYENTTLVTEFFANGLNLRSNTAIIFGALDLAPGSYATIRRRAANNFQFGETDAAAPVAQTLSVQSVVAGTTNTAGANLTITGSQGTGTGAGGSIVFQVAPAGSSGTAQNALVSAFQIGDVNVPRSFILKSATTDIMFGVGVNGATPNSQLTLTIAGQGAAYFTPDGVFAGGGKALGFAGSTGDVNSAPDVYLRRDAANTLALRNGGTASVAAPQTFNIYNFWQDASNYSRIAIASASAAGGAAIISQGAGTGSATAIRIRVEGNQNIWFDTASTSRAFIDYSGNFGFGNNVGGDNAYDFGFTVYGNNRPRDVGIGRNILQGVGYYQMSEMTAPAAPATNNVRIYAEDNGSGKTRLMALFATGSAVQIAVEP